MIDAHCFDEAYRKVTADSKKKSGIGSLSEKSLHRILKYYYEPREEFREIPFMGSVADIKNEEGIYEIQTGSLSPLIPKLEKFLPEEKVCVICPIIREKHLIWIDPETGELKRSRKSPKRGRFSDALPEISKIKKLLFSKNLTVRLLLLDADEYKYLDGYGKDKKKRATKLERLPRRLIEEKDIKSLSDLKDILPALPEVFTSKDFGRATGLGRRKLFFSMKMLEELCIIEKTGKNRNAYLYGFKKYED